MLYGIVLLFCFRVVYSYTQLYSFSRTSRSVRNKSFSHPPSADSEGRHLVAIVEYEKLLIGSSVCHFRGLQLDFWYSGKKSNKLMTVFYVCCVRLSAADWSETQRLCFNITTVACRYNYVIYVHIILGFECTGPVLQLHALHTEKRMHDRTQNAIPDNRIGWIS